MSDVTINIYGGNNQILPNATQAVQNFYGEESASSVPENSLFARYHSQLSECKTATELAQVVMTMLTHEPEVNKEEIVKERFIKKLLPLAPQILKGTSIDNIRARINDALAKRTRKGLSHV